MSAELSVSSDAGGVYPAAAIAAAWKRERPCVPTESIEIVTPIWQLAKLFARHREHALAGTPLDAAKLDLLSTLRREGTPYELDTREITRRSLVSAGAISQRIAKAETAGYVRRRPAGRGKTVIVSLTDHGHRIIEAGVDHILSSEAALIADFDIADREALVRLLDRLLSHVNRIA